MTKQQPSLLPNDATEAAGNRPYTVLARKYRPQTFAELIGQDAMVRVLTNAIKTGRVAQAFMLTGVRGVGKTTTARIIARALNCVGPDGKGGPTTAPCGACEHCKAIAEDRHVDVIEMDAASRTGVDNIRDLTDGVRYKPVTARYKVYIVDEVHMLSTQAFNALLKTLEEPPPHVKFVFATTEIRKVPVTVLSRCQRFDLRRVDHAALVAQYARIAEREKIAIAPAALALIARAADGSVRDGLSLLDQAIAMGGEAIDEARVRDMLGLADRAAIFDLFEQIMRGKTAEALDGLGAMYTAGADPAVVIEDLLELTHWLTRLRLVPAAAEQPGVPEAERVRGKALAEKLSLATLTRNWQILLKGLREVQGAPAPIQAAEMVLVRLAYAADLPNPADLVRTLSSEGAPARPSPSPSPAPRAPQPAPTHAGESPRANQQRAGESPRADQQRAGESPRANQQRAGESPRADEAQAPIAPAPPAPVPRSFVELVALVGERREAILHAHLETNVHAVRYEPGRLEFRPKPNAPPDLANRLGRLLGDWTGKRWVVSVSNEKGEPTLREQRENRAESLRREAAEHPLVRAVQSVFPDAAITSVRERPKPAPGEAAEDPEAEAEA